MKQTFPIGAPTTEHFRRVREVFESALQQEPQDRARFVEQAGGGDTVLISEVQRMLSADAQSYALLDHGNFPEAPLTVGSVFAGNFDVLGLLGRGGMGEVYHGRDANLQRDVALKILPAAFTRDPDRLSRFRREAQLLASLNHPNIGAIYSFEEADGVQALALELVEGPTLAERIAQGPIPLDEALPVARQIAKALEAAHEQGMVHRDLKPANVKLRSDGVVKVLDFGLAKAVQLPESRHTGGSETPDITSPAMLAMGLLIGTPAYMAPEQARGTAADKRADIWAFGAVLYEMLSGRRAFRGDTVSDTLASVLRQDLDWTAIPSATPAAVRNLIARCLERDPKQRLRDIGEARILLGHPAAFLAPTHPQANTPTRSAPFVLTAVVSGLLIGATAVYFNKSHSGPARVVRLSLNLPDGQPLFTNRATIAISPDGSQIVFAKSYGLYVRSLAEPETKIVRGTESFFNITEPAFSPDGRFIVFHSVSGTDRTLKRIPVTGGAALTICDVVSPTGVSWAPEGIIYASMNLPPSLAVWSQREIANLFTTIFVVQPDGGSPKTLVKSEKGEVVHRAQYLPGGRHILYTLARVSSPNLFHDTRIVAQDLKTGERITIREGASDARYVPTGHLVYAVSGSLFTVAFDPHSLKTAGSAVSLIEGVMRADPGLAVGVHYTFADNGTLIYLPGPVSPRSDVATADRHGQIEPLHLPPHPYEAPRISPDGTQIAMHSTEGDESTIYVYDLSRRSALRRLTFEGNNRLPVWTSQGQRIAFQSDREGDHAIFWQRADGAGSAERLTRPEPGERHQPEAWSRTMDTLLFTVAKGETLSLWMLSLRTRKTTPFGNVRSSTPTGAVFSTDGKWVAYATSEGVKTTIYVQPFPPTGVRHELLREGAEKPNHPVWSPDDKELYFNPGPGQFKAVSVTTEPKFAFGAVVSLPRPFRAAHTSRPRAYDVSPDGKFIAAISASQSGPERPGTPQINVVLNWFVDLRARVPVSR